MTNRSQMRAAKAIERKSLAGAPWPAWRWSYFPKGSVGPRGWTFEIDTAASNTVYAVLLRKIDGTLNGRVHLAIRTPANREPPWRDLQRIKNELMGSDRFAVQVCPPDNRLIDDADMYHLWVMPNGYVPGFGLHPYDEGREA